MKRMKNDKAFEWFREARFGMFIHWGLYSVAAGEWGGKEIPAISEWIMYFAKAPLEEYRKLTEGFTGSEFNAEKYVDLAVRTGMKYIVVSSKHHEGFSLFDTKYSDYKSTTMSPFGRDAIRELADACKKRGVKLGIYYSQAQDWEVADAYGNTWDFCEQKDKNFKNYFEAKVKPQVRELLTNYGDISIMWFDTPMGMTEEQSIELRDFVKSIQPDCLISGRIGNGVGDYKSTGDNMIPTGPMMTDWEVPATFNDSWGYRKADKNWKSPKDVIKKLVNINSKGGNFLLNIGPDVDGRIPDECINTMERIGEWIKVNGDSIYETSGVPAFPYLFEFGDITTKKSIDGKPGKVYLHIFNWGRGYDDIEGEILLYGIKNKVIKAYALAEPDEEIRIVQFQPTKSRNLHSLKVMLPNPGKPYDEIDSVICLEIEGNLEVDVIKDETAI